MSENSIYVTGHKNPDLDSIAAAHVYAHLKNRIDPDNEYIAVRCGSLNTQTRRIFEKLNIKPPKYLKDVKAKTSDVVNRDVPRLYVTDPLQSAIALLDETNLSLLPVFNDEGIFQGIISSTEISHFMMRETFGVRPVYHFRMENLSKVLPGQIISQGTNQEFTAPIMIGAMPFERSVERITALEQNRPLLIVGLRRDLVEYAAEHDFPALILTGATEEEAARLDFSRYSGTVYLSDIDTAETIRLLRFSTPLDNLVNRDAIRLNLDDDFDYAKKVLSQSGQRGLPVFDNNSDHDQFEGIVSRASFMDKPRKNLILVDHNEIDQSISGASQARILEIVDHHRIGTIMSREPFSLLTKPIGSTCTIIRQLYRQYGIAIPTEIAKLMLSAILSDTVMLKSPTTTDEDIQTAEGLAKHAGVNLDEWAKDLFANETELAQMNPEKAVMNDFKTYSLKNIDFGIGQVEVQTLSSLDEALEKLKNALRKIRAEQSLNGIMLLITDIMRGDSVLIMDGFENIRSTLPFENLGNGVYNLPGILSRKKQLLPEVLKAVEENL